MNPNTLDVVNLTQNRPSLRDYSPTSISNDHNPLDKVHDVEDLVYNPKVIGWILIDLLGVCIVWLIRMYTLEKILFEGVLVLRVFLMTIEEIYRSICHLPFHCLIILQLAYLTF